MTTYKNNLVGFKKWCKDNAWNDNAVKEFHKLETSEGHVFVELSQSEFKGMSACFTAVRTFNEEHGIFKNYFREHMEPELFNRIKVLTDSYAKRHEINFVNYPL